MSNLLECPVCNAEAVEEIFLNNEYSFYCEDCGYESPPTLIQNEAIILFQDAFNELHENKELEENITEIENDIDNLQRRIEDLESDIWDYEEELKELKKERNNSILKLPQKYLHSHIQIDIFQTNLNI